MCQCLMVCLNGFKPWYLITRHQKKEQSALKSFRKLLRLVLHGMKRTHVASLAGSRQTYDRIIKLLVCRFLHDIVFFVFYAQHLKELQNFNGLLAVSGGLTNSVLSRLHLTREYISPDCKEVWY